MSIIKMCGYQVEMAQAWSRYKCITQVYSGDGAGKTIQGVNKAAMAMRSIPDRIVVGNFKYVSM